MHALETLKNPHALQAAKKIKKASRLSRLVPQGVSRRVGRTTLVLAENSPKLLFVGGVVGVVGTVVLASRATLKLNDVMDDIEGDIADAKRVLKLDRPDYTDRDYKKDMTVLYLRGTGRLARLYGPTFILGVTSIAALAASHNILQSRNSALTAAYIAVDKSFKEYRRRVAEELGEERDLEFLHSSEERLVVEDTDKGLKKKHVKHYGPDGTSPYARLFDASNDNWEPTPEINLLFLRAQQNYLNQKLRMRGHVTLNDAYDLLGLSRTKAGMVVGWIYDDKSPNHDGDNYISFGVWSDNDLDKFHDFMIGREKALLLDFNVDGPIYDKL